MNRWKKLEPLLRCLSCKKGLRYNKDRYTCTGCAEQYPIIDGVARFVPESYYLLDAEDKTVEQKTKNYFGYEWDWFKDWGFVKESEVPDGERSEWTGGTIEARKAAFESKCRLTRSMLKAGPVLDAGCGNGRYTFEAAERTKSLVIGVDIGYGAVNSAAKNCSKKTNVVILQASLFDLPFKDGAISNAFSNGVLMHTGDAHKAFLEIARTLRRGGNFTAHVYRVQNLVWEGMDRLIRSRTTKLTVEEGTQLALRLSRLAKVISKVPGLLTLANVFMRLQTTPHHMFDWYLAPVASHHTHREVTSWFREAGFGDLSVGPQSRLYPVVKGEAVNIRGKKK